MDRQTFLSVVPYTDPNILSNAQTLSVIRIASWFVLFTAKQKKTGCYTARGVCNSRVRREKRFGRKSFSPSYGDSEE